MTWRLHPDVVTRQMGDAMVLVNLTDNAIYELNSTGARILELLKAGAGRDELADRLAVEFTVDRTTIVADLDRLVGELTRAGMIHGRDE